MTSGTATGLDPLALFAAAADRLGKRIPSIDLGAAVPACRSWSAYDLLVHLGNVHAWAATIVETGRSAATHNDEPVSRRPRMVADWYAGKAEDLYEVLRSSDPEQPCWNFAFGDGEAGFWRRRQLHEVTVHAFDLEAACGSEPLPIAADVAGDGVDEVLTVMLARMHHRGFPAELSAPLSLISTDTGRAWSLTPRRLPGLRAVPPQPRSPEAAGPDQSRAPRGEDGPPLVDQRRLPASDQVEGTAAALYLALWKRAPSDVLTRTGDRARIDAFLGSRLVP